MAVTSCMASILEKKIMTHAVCDGVDAIAAVAFRHQNVDQGRILLEVVIQTYVGYLDLYFDIRWFEIELESGITAYEFLHSMVSVEMIVEIRILRLENELIGEQCLVANDIATVNMNYQSLSEEVLL